MIYNPSDLLPQKPPMEFISAIESFDMQTQELTARVDVSENDLLFQKDINGVQSTASLEYMAQSIACFIGCQDIHLKGATKANAGFIMGSRDLHMMAPVYNVGESYYIHVKSLFCDDNIASFECEITASNGTVMATGNVNAFRPDDLQNFMQGGNL